VTPGLEELVAESLDAVRPEPGQSLRDLVIAERSRVAATHSRLIRRQATFVAARPTDRNALAPAALRLDELETGSHSAGALFKLLFGRWRA
jgi:hypothetical protein